MTKEQILEDYFGVSAIKPTQFLKEMAIKAMEEYAQQEVAKERESHINMVKQIVELLGFAKCLNILDAIEKWQKEREEAKKLVEALDVIYKNTQDKLIYDIAKQSLTEYEKL